MKWISNFNTRNQILSKSKNFLQWFNRWIVILHRNVRNSEKIENNKDFRFRENFGDDSFVCFLSVFVCLAGGLRPPAPPSFLWIKRLWWGGLDKIHPQGLFLCTFIGACGFVGLCAASSVRAPKSGAACKPCEACMPCPTSVLGVTSKGAKRWILCDALDYLISHFVRKKKLNVPILR
jgi:hypothetical protein